MSVLDQIPDEYKMQRQGKTYVLYGGLIDYATAHGLKGIKTELKQVPTEENGRVAIVHARVLFKDADGTDREFDAIGDASPENVGRNIQPHIIRMAETRAKARALRDAINVGGEDPDDPTTQQQPHDEQGTAPSPQLNTEEERGMREMQGAATQAKAPDPKAPRKSQLDLLRTLAEELRGENGVARLEGRIGKPLNELTRTEAEEWIDRLTPAEGRE